MNCMSRHRSRSQTLAGHSVSLLPFASHSPCPNSGRVFGASPTDAPPSVTAVKVDTWIVPDIDALPNNEWGKTVRFGRKLTVATYADLGPGVADPAQRVAGSCHREAGTKEFSLPFVGVFADFPQYRSREGEVGTLEERINGCMTRSLNGRALPVGSEEMNAFVAYTKFLSAAPPIGAKTLGRGSGEMAELTRP